MTSATEPEVNALPTCSWTGFCVPTFVADLTDLMQRDTSIAKALRHDLTNNRPTNAHVVASAEAHLERREQSVAQIKHLLEAIAMGKETAEQLAVFCLGRGPCTVRHLAGLLYQHGRSFTDAEVQAKEVLAKLVVEKRAELKEVHGVDLYLITSKTPMEKRKDDDATR